MDLCGEVTMIIRIEVDVCMSSIDAYTKSVAMEQWFQRVYVLFYVLVMLLVSSPTIFSSGQISRCAT